jgi:regulatory protein
MKANNPNSPEECFGCALKILNRGAQTEKKMVDKLLSRGYEAEVIAGVLERLKSLKLIDDLKYASDYIAFRSRSAPLGGRYLKLKLLQRGIPAEIIGDSLAELSADDEYENALVAAQKKLTLLSRYDAAKQKEKIYSFLVSRGFNQGAIYKVLKELF